MPFIGSSPAEVALTTGDLGDAIVNEAKMQISNSPVNGYMLTAQSGDTGGLTWASAGGGILLQIVEMTFAKANGPTTIPFDDTVPTNTEGTEIGSQAITMADDSNKCLIEGQLQIGIDDVAFGPIVAVFRGSTNIGTYDYDQTDSQAQTQSIPIHILDSPATAGSVTYSVRIGVQGSATWRLNFGTSGDDYGGSRKSTLFLKEISA